MGELGACLDSTCRAMLDGNHPVLQVNEGCVFGGGAVCRYLAATHPCAGLWPGAQPEFSDDGVANMAIACIESWIELMETHMEPPMHALVAGQCFAGTGGDE